MSKPVRVKTAFTIRLNFINEIPPEEIEKGYDSMMVYAKKKAEEQFASCFPNHNDPLRLVSDTRSFLLLDGEIKDIDEKP